MSELRPKAGEDAPGPAGPASGAAEIGAPEIGAPSTGGSDEELAPDCEAEGRFAFAGVGLAVVELAFEPGRTYARFDWDGGFRRPFLFVTLLAGPAVAMGHALGTWLETGSLESLSPWVFLALLALAPGLYVYLRAQMIHLALVLQGAARRPFEATFRAVAYANGAVALLCVLPLLGAFAFLVWATLIELTGLMAAQELALGAAIRAILVPTFALVAAVAARVAFEYLVSG